MSLTPGSTRLSAAILLISHAGPTFADPPLELTPTPSGGMTVEYQGVLQESPNLVTWTDVTPQPASPWVFNPAPSTKFYRSKAVAGNGILEMPGVFTDFMVLQREQPNPVWGYVAPNADVDIVFGDLNFHVVCDASGRFEVTLPAMPITWAGRSLRVSTGWQELSFDNVVVGDVWLAAGGTAMNRPMSAETSAIAIDDRNNAFDDMLRVFAQEELLSATPRKGSSGTWQPTVPGVTPGMAALPYFTVKKLRSEMGIPTGIIECAVDGLGIESFISPATLATFPEGQTLAAGNPLAGQAYNGLIAPLAKLPVRGFIWMPDASDATAAKAPVYDKLAAKLAADWRAAWGNTSLPFYFVQPANYNSPTNVSGEGGPWVLLQDELRQADLDVANSGLVVANDIGSPSDPLGVDREELGTRLGQLILPSDYVAPGDYPNGPLYLSKAVAGSNLEITFSNASGLTTTNALPPAGFEIRSFKGEWTAANATISGAKVILSSPAVPSPVAARYAWDSNPTTANLTNIAGLPASAFTTDSALEMSGYFSNNMILQRQKATPVWGWARPGSPVTVAFGGSTLSTSADHTGHWQVILNNLAANSTGRTLTVTTTSGTTSLTGVLVGEVWLGAGQSNMSHPLGWFPSTENDNERATANDPLLRVFVATEQARKDPQRFCGGNWLKAQSGDMYDMPATPYYFAKRLRAELNIPIAVMECGWGGQPIEGFISDEKLLAMGSEGADVLNEKQGAYAVWNQYLADYAAWESGGMIGAPPEQPGADPQFEGYLGAQIYNGMIAPLVGTGMRGIIWYQGEQNSHSWARDFYQVLFEGLVADWRADWQETLPFYYMQLPNYEALNDPYGPLTKWVNVQNAQRKALGNLNSAGMAIGNDIGDPANIHPVNKSDVGDRLSRWALVNQYGQSGITLTGPIYLSHAKVGSTIEVEFNYATGLKSRDGQPLGAFEIKNPSGNWVAATATISGQKVVISATGVTNPVAARYAWAPNPTGANLANGANLPASLFTTE